MGEAETYSYSRVEPPTGAKSYPEGARHMADQHGEPREYDNAAGGWGSLKGISSIEL